jgi:hypothetical protein
MEQHLNGKISRRNREKIFRLVLARCKFSRFLYLARISLVEKSGRMRDRLVACLMLNFVATAL